MKIRREAIEKSCTDWRRQHEVKKLRVMMIVVAVFLGISVVAGAVLAFLQIKGKNDAIASETARLVSAAVQSDPVSSAPSERNILLLVNSANKLPDDYTLQLTAVDGIEVDSNIVSDLSAMMSAAKNDGVSLKLVSGYVDAAAQEELYQAEVERLMTQEGKSMVFAEDAARSTVGRGGYSENQTGLAVEFSSENSEEGAVFQDSAEYHWLISNCASYGFVLRYPAGKKSITGFEENPAHFRYVGKQAALKMRALAMCLEEYSTYISNQNNS